MAARRANQATHLRKIIYTDQGATFDEDRAYRYLLWRKWANGTLVLWILLNPSTADEHVLDPTLRRVEAFTRAWGHTGFIVANAFAYRSTDPGKLYRFDVEPVGNDNDQHIKEAASSASIIVCGWGTEPIAVDRALRITHLLRYRRLYCLGVNKNGSPRHPLYLAGKTQLATWREAAA